MPLIGRREMLAGGAAAGVAASVPAQARATPLARRPLWPGAAPGGDGVTVTEQAIPRSATGPQDDLAWLNVTRPWLASLRPARPRGAAMLLVPGGGYARVAVGRDNGRGLMGQFAELGFHAYLMTYRLPQDGWAAGPDVALQDAQRALRIIRADAEREGFAADRIGVAGFSAGGHVAGMLATRPGDSYRPVDAIDRLPLGVRAAALCFPVITMYAPIAHGGSRNNLIGRDPPQEAERAASVEHHVTAATPPVFLAHALDDPVVPVDNSLTMLAALRTNKVPCELHLFETGGHGLPAAKPEGTAPAWLQRFGQWAESHGL